MSKIKAKQLKEYVWNLKPNEHFFLNALNCTGKTIEVLRDMIADGTIELDEVQLKALIVPKAWCKFLSGECISPQMEYIKRKDPQLYKKNFLITFDAYPKIEFEVNARDGEQAMLKALEIAKYYKCTDSVMHINLIRH